MVLHVFPLAGGSLKRAQSSGLTGPLQLTRQADNISDLTVKATPFLIRSLLWPVKLTWVTPDRPLTPPSINTGRCCTGVWHFNLPIVTGWLLAIYFNAFSQADTIFISWSNVTSQADKSSYFWFWQGCPPATMSVLRSNLTLTVLCCGLTWPRLVCRPIWPEPLLAVYLDPVLRSIETCTLCWIPTMLTVVRLDPRHHGLRSLWTPYPCLGLIETLLFPLLVKLDLHRNSGRPLTLAFLPLVDPKAGWGLTSKDCSYSCLLNQLLVNLRSLY